MMRNHPLTDSISNVELIKAEADKIIRNYLKEKIKVLESRFAFNKNYNELNQIFEIKDRVIKLRVIKDMLFAKSGEIIETELNDGVFTFKAKINNSTEWFSFQCTKEYMKHLFKVGWFEEQRGGITF